MTRIPYTDDEGAFVDELISWALEEDNTSLAPGWLDDRFGSGAASALQLAYGKASGGVTKEDVMEVAQDDGEAVYVVIQPDDGPSDEWHLEVLDAPPEWPTSGQIVRIASINGGDSLPVHVRPGTAERADVTVRLARAFDLPFGSMGMNLGSERALLDVFSFVQGIVNEYRDGGDQMVEATCICQVSSTGRRVAIAACPEHGRIDRG